MQDEEESVRLSSLVEEPDFIAKIHGSVFCYTQRNATITTFIALIILGVVFGLIMPKDDDLSKDYRPFSNIIGYTYFFAWSISFYPQIFLNYFRKTTVGLSPDYQCYNIVGFACYTVFNLLFYYSPTVQEDYRSENDGHENKVQFNDVLFALHAVAATSFTISQIVIYDGRKQMPSLLSRVSSGFMVVLILAYMFVVLSRESERRITPWTWLDWAYFLSYIKMLITLVKYIPQVMLNYTRKSTVGWNIWNVVLDFTGGALSVLQLVLDCWNDDDWSGISGDPVKFGLGLISIIFDVIFMVQHFILYPDSHERGSEEGDNDMLIHDSTKQNPSAYQGDGYGDRQALLSDHRQGGGGGGKNRNGSASDLSDSYAQDPLIASGLMFRGRSSSSENRGFDGTREYNYSEEEEEEEEGGREGDEKEGRDVESGSTVHRTTTLTSDSSLDEEGIKLSTTSQDEGYLSMKEVDHVTGEGGEETHQLI